MFAFSPLASVCLVSLDLGEHCGEVLVALPLLLRGMGGEVLLAVLLILRGVGGEVLLAVLLILQGMGGEGFPVIPPALGGGDGVDASLAPLVLR